MVDRKEMADCKIKVLFCAIMFIICVTVLIHCVWFIKFGFLNMFHMCQIDVTKLQPYKGRNRR